MLKANSLLIASGLILGLSACSKDDKTDTPGTATAGKFIIAATPIASQGVADYLLTADDLESGTISTVGNGIEQDGTYRYYTTSGNKFFSMLYGQGNPGAVTVYDLDANGKLQKLSDFQTETVQAFAAVNDDILLVKNARQYASPVGQWFSVSTESMTITNQGEINFTQIANNGELSHFSWIQQVGNKVYAPFFSIKATTEGGWTTAYPDSAWIAVYNYPSMTFDKVIKDNRTSSIGLYFQNGLTVVDNGDVYCFSPANTVGKQDSTQYFNSTKKSAITRIKSGTSDFDQSYYFDVQTPAGGAYITGWVNVGGGKVVAAFNTADKRSQWNAANKLAVIDLASKSFQWVTGAPDAANIASFSLTNYSAKDGNAYIGITTTDNVSAVYKVSAATATATKGLVVEGGKITSIQYVPAAK